MKKRTLVTREANLKTLTDSTRTPASRSTLELVGCLRAQANCGLLEAEHVAAREPCDDFDKGGVESSSSSETVSIQLPRRTMCS